MNRASAFSVRSLIHSYEGITALDIPQLDIARGEICILSGPNGSGKTTLLSIFAQLLAPSSGSILMLGNEIVGSRDLKLRRKVTLVHQKPFVFSTSVWSNIAYGLRAINLSVKEIKNRVRLMLREMNLESIAQKPARKLSGGEAQRVALARALVLETPIVLLDEPTNSLDDASRPALLHLVQKINQTNATTFIIASHDLQFLSPIASRVIHLNEGKIIHGHP
jgi:tungstate transport system ATP-binding protein